MEGVNKIIRILLIDDDEDEHFFFLEALHKVNSGAICDCLANGKAGLAQLNSATTLPDYVFLDLNMPRMNGMEVLKTIKATSGIANIPVIIYSTSQSQDDMAQAKALGAAQYISKPNTINQLVDILLQLFNAQS